MMSDSSSNAINYPRRRKITRRHEALSSSDDSEDDTPIKRPVRGVRLRVTSSSESSDSSFTEPTKKKVRHAIVESDSTDSSDSCDSEGPALPRKRKGTILSDNDGTDSEVAVALGSASTRVPKGDDGSSSDSDGAERCIICFKTLHYPVALPSGCSHQFHEVCLATWSRTSNTCPIDRVKYKYIKIINATGEVLSQRSVTTPPPQVHNDLEPDNPTFCEVCNQHDRESEMLLCDRCEAGYHLDCLDPPLEGVPSGDWFCPECTNNEGIEDSEVLELLADSVLLESRLRHNRPSVPLRRSSIRDSRFYYARQALQAATNIANNYANSQPSTSAGTSFASSSNSSRKSRSQSRKKSRRKGTTRYKVELVTTEDGTTVEVKLAIKAKGKRKSSKKKSRKAGRGSSRYSNRACEREAGSSSLAGSGHRPTLDLFGSRPTLDYFSGCEAEDEEEVFGQGEVGLLRRGTVARSGLSSRKQIARLLATNQPTRPRVVVPAQPAASTNILDNILRDQTLWHDPAASIVSNSAGEVKVTLPQGRSGCSVRSAATHSGDDRNNSAGRFSNGSGTSYGAQGGTSSGRSHASGSTGGGSGTPGASSDAGSAGGEPSGSVEIPRVPAPPLPPLIPPPEPPLKLCEDDDFDLYADIEPLHAVKFRKERNRH